MEEEDNIIIKWAQEDVETSYSLLNIYIYIYIYIYKLDKFTSKLGGSFQNSICFTVPAVKHIRTQNC